jgi:DNA-binding CsgD family transcriptional regulator
VAKNVPIGLADLHTQIKITNRLLAVGLKERMKQNELIQLLARTGATHQEIADVLNTTSATVAVTLQRLRKKAAGGG